MKTFTDKEVRNKRTHISGRRLGTVTYQEKSEWVVYVPEKGYWVLSDPQGNPREAR